jgi:hypothetical protein
MSTSGRAALPGWQRRQPPAIVTTEIKPLVWMTPYRMIHATLHRELSGPLLVKRLH